MVKNISYSTIEAEMHRSFPGQQDKNQEIWYDKKQIPAYF